MKIDKYYITISETQGLPKSPTMWGVDETANIQYPLIYFKRPKHLNEESFKALVSSLIIGIDLNPEILKTTSL